MHNTIQPIQIANLHYIKLRTYIPTMQPDIQKRKVKYVHAEGIM